MRRRGRFGAAVLLASLSASLLVPPPAAAEGGAFDLSSAFSPVLTAVSRAVFPPSRAAEADPALFAPQAMSGEGTAARLRPPAATRPALLDGPLLLRGKL
ncbi:hypothetical protein [Salinarimonas sp.]|uniref:hypothetical protein n=1 Tax=Salinarimonas sp. TaxID=2766526 RepID=UPI00391DFB26